jgi:VWA domain-containing protein
MNVLRRQAPSAFNASLLDMMTCGFGAIILLFVLKASIDAKDLSQTVSRVSRAASVLAALQQEKIELARSIERLRGENAALVSPSMWGLPPISGDLIVLVDVSASMRTPKIESAVADIIGLVLRDNPEIAQVKITRFASKVETNAWVDWRPPDAVSGTQFAEGMFNDDLQGGTNLLDGLGVALRDAAGRSLPTTVLLVSDGMHNTPANEANIATDAALQRLLAYLPGDVERRAHPVTVDVIGLFRVSAADSTHLSQKKGGFSDGLACESPVSGERSDTLRLARLLRAVAHKWHGVLLGVTLPCG